MLTLLHLYAVSIVALATAFTTASQVGSSRLSTDQVSFNLNASKKNHPYGFWGSPITTEWVTNQTNALEDVFVDRVTGKVYYTERRSHEGGRNVLKDLESHEPLFDGLWNARTRVHEYGGGQNVAHNGTLYFSNLPDGRVYEVKSGSIPKPVTPNKPNWRWADFDVHPQYSRYITAILEDHDYRDGPTDSAPRGRVDNRIALIDVETGYVRRSEFVAADFIIGGPPSTLPDFWDTPRFSPDGKSLVVRQWYHPNMSWEASELWMIDVENIETGGDPLLILNNPRRIAGDRNKIAVGEPNWVDSNRLIFTSDQNGYINPWLYDLRTESSRPLSPSPIREDFGEPAFWLGLSNGAVLDDDHAIYSAFRGGRSQLYIFKLSDGTYEEVCAPFAYISHLRRVADGKVVFLGRMDTSSSSIVVMTVDTRDIQGTLSYKRIETPHSAASATIPTSYISLPTSFALQRPRTNEPIHATYYPPTNSAYAGGLPGELPPVVVNMHGGPTHLSPQGFSAETQLFTSRGFAWLDVNYGGSMMYGRAYRERLLGKWGIVDVEDSMVAVNKLGKRGLLDVSRAVIRGGSAGGFTTFTALATHPDALAAGMSMFGVSDLRTLQAVLHKFESHYLLKYVGGTPETDPQRWWERSPISKAADIKSPLLILQGAEDSVVPVDQAITMLETIKRHGGRAELRIFEGEGHGWRQAKTVWEALELELGWYQRVFNDTLTSVL